MRRSRLERIRDCIRQRSYDITAHAMEEMAEDLLDIEDVETAVLSGEIRRFDRTDVRGTKYVVQGRAADGQRPVGVVGRFTEGDHFLVITVYEVT